MDIDLRIMELLASKICHDLVSPVGAINNGVELIEDIGGSVVDEAMQLIGNSAIQAARRLRLFRLAYGRAGNENTVTFKDVRETIEAFLDGGKIKLNFAQNFPPEGLTDTPGALRVMMNMILLADEALVYGGEVHIRPATDAFQGGVSIAASGRAAALGEATLDAFNGAAAAENIGPRTVHAYVTGCFARHFGFRVGIESAAASETVLLHFARS